MAVSNSHSQNGFCSKTLTFHSLRPPSFLPPQATHLSVTDFIFSLLNTTTTTAGSLIDATTRHRIPYTDVKLFVRNLAAALRQPPVSLTKGNCAFIISHNSSYLPILFLSLFSVGVTVSPANPASSISEISRQIRICKPAVIFATVESVRKVLKQWFTQG
ncbi:putative AMP-dependent synthetase/ligase, ANL domain-containing protein [Helianthus debilis subsp. tardiflorus]